MVFFSNFSLRKMVNSLQMAITANRETLMVRDYNNVTLNLLRFLESHGFISSFNIRNCTTDSKRLANFSKKNFKLDTFCLIRFKFINNKNFIEKIKYTFTYNKYMFLTYSKLKEVSFNFTGIFVLNTSYGFLTHTEALSLGIGGTLLFIIFF